MLKERLQNIPLGVKAAVVYTMASVFSRGLSMITVPIFTRIMSTSEIGMVNLYNSWYSLLSVIATLSLTSGGFQAAMKDFEGERDQYQSAVLTLTSMMAIVLGCIYQTIIHPSSSPTLRSASGQGERPGGSPGPRTLRGVVC